jgi:hypothetical protein
MSKTGRSSSTRPRTSQGTSKKGGKAGPSKDSGRCAPRRPAYGASSGCRKDRARELIDSRLARIGFVLTCLFGLSGVLFWFFPYSPSDAHANEHIYGPGVTANANPHTTVTYVLDGPRYNTLPLQKERLACAQPALSSARSDAYLCYIVATSPAAILLDPCFAASAYSVVCAWKPGTIQRFPVNGPLKVNSDPIGSLPDLSTVWPWAIRLSNGAECRWKYVTGKQISFPSRPSKPARYACGTTAQGAMVVITAGPIGPNGLRREEINGIFMLKPSSQPQGIATQLQHGAGGVWKVLYSAKANSPYQNVNVTAMWY